MTFLSPLVLLALAALAVPILLHLFRRGEGPVRAFPAFRYLRRTTREQARAIRLRQLVLLALRAALIVLLAVAGARLVLPLGGADHPAAAMVLVVDNGLTSGTVVDGRRILDDLVELGVQALERTGAADRIWVVPAGEPWVPSLPDDRRAAADRLRSLEPSHAPSDLGRALARGRALLGADASDRSQILVLSNLDGVLDPPAGPGAGPVPPALLVTPRIVLPPNRGIAEARVGVGLPPRTGEATEIRLGVVGHEPEDVPFTIRIDEEVTATGRTGPDGEGSATLPPFPAGWVTARVEIEPDPLRADDVRHLAFRVEPPPRVALAGTASPFLDDALDALQEGGRIVRAPAGGADVVVVTGGGAPAGLGRARWLPDDPEAPGLVLLAPDSPEGLPVTNRLLDELRTGWRLEPAPPAAPAGIAAVDPRGRLPGEPRVRDRYRIAHSDGLPPSTVLALEDGAPWLVRRPVPGPNVLLLASPLTAEAGDVPTSAAMIPLVELLLSLARGSPEVRTLTAGEPLRLPPGTHQVRLPGGTLRPVDGMSVFAETGRAGVYDALDGEGELLARVTVNPAPPVDAHPREPEGAAALLGPGVRGMGSDEPWIRQILADRRGREVWRPVAVLAFLLLIVEGWYAAAGRAAVSSARPEDARVPAS